jgi:hypothetical protein
MLPAPKPSHGKSVPLALRCSHRFLLFTNDGERPMKLKTAPAVMRINAKCSDLFSAMFDDATGNTVAEYVGYVPGFMPGQHWGDYVELDIDLKTGAILNWKAPSLASINEALKDGAE